MVERRGGIVSARTIDILAVHDPDGRLVGWTATSPGGRCLPDERRPLAACDVHMGEEIEVAEKRWQSGNDDESDHEQEDE